MRLGLGRHKPARADVATNIERAFDRRAAMADLAKSVQKGVGPAIDRALGVVFPGWAKRRQAARLSMAGARIRMGAIAGVYGGARKDRLYKNWTPTDASADAALLDDHKELRERSRELNRDNPIAAAITRSIVDNVVGTGILPQATPSAEALGISQEEADAWADACEAEWRRAVPFVDVALRTDAYGLQRLACRKLVEDGESFARPLVLRDRPAPFETCVQTLESDQVDNPTGLKQKTGLRNGIELGEHGEPVAYYIADRHPGDYAIDPAASRPVWRRVAAFDDDGRRRVWHLYAVKRPGQSRGEPMFAPVLTALKDFAEYAEAERVAARVNACFAAFVTKNDPWSALDGNAQTTTAAGDRLEELVPGIVEYLLPGESVTFGQPTRPGGTFEPYVYAMLRQIGAAIGLPLELVLLDFSKTNYSSARAALLEARRFFKQMQDLLIERFCQPLYAAVIEEAWLKGRLPGAEDFLERFDLWTACDWVRPGWGWVDPTKEIEASTMAMESGLSTLAEECAGQGRDWQANLRQQVREQRLRAKLGLTGSSEEFGAMVRAGLLTPQLADEERIRERMGLEPPSEDVRRTWVEEGGARRPITLTQPAETPIEPAPSSRTMPAPEPDEEAVPA